MKSLFLLSLPKKYGGIEYAQQKMDEIAQEVRYYIDENVKDPALKDAYSAYLEYAIARKS